jgi:CBS domain-containing protein
MVNRGIKRLPVVDGAGKLVGIVTRGDLVKVFARPDADIEREIREDVVKRAFWIDDPALEIRVEQGNVRLAGRIARRTDVELLPAVVGRVPGVVSVHSTLRWRHDDRGVPLDEFESAMNPMGEP